MNIHHPTSKLLPKDTSHKVELSEEQIIASLYKDVNHNADNEDWSPSNPKVSLYANKTVGSKSLTLSSSSSPKKPKQNLNKQKTLPPPFSPSLKIITTEYDFGDDNDVDNNAKDTMESPTFCQPVAIATQSPSFNNARQSPETFCHKHQKGEKESQFFSEVETKASTPKNTEKETPIDTKEKTNIKITSILEGQKAKNTITITPKNITSLGAFHEGEYNYPKAISHIEKDERLYTDENKIGSENKDYQFFVNALEEFKEENRELINQLELPASSPEIPESSRTGAAGGKTGFSVKGEDGDTNQLADPVSLGTLEGESAILLNTEEIDSTLMDSQLKFWRGSSIRKSPDPTHPRDSPLFNPNSPFLNPSPKDMKEIRFGKSENTPTNGKPGIKSQPTIKQETQPRMVEITLMLDSKNKPKIDQKTEHISSLDLMQKFPSPKLRANNSLPSAGDSINMAAIQGSLSLHGSMSHHKKKTITPKASMFKDSKGLLSPNKGTRFFSKTPQGSPKVKPFESPSAASVKSPVSSSFQKLEAKSLTNSPVKNNKNSNVRFGEKPVERTRTPQRANKSQPEISKNSIKPSPIKNIEPKRVDRNSKQLQLNDYLNEDTINMPSPQQNGQKLEMIEQNLRQIKGKNLLTPTSQKHIRYPSFGGNNQDKESKSSTRRTISQEPHSEYNSKNSAKSRGKLDISKDTSIKDEHDNSSISIKSKSNASQIISTKDFELGDPRRRTPEMPKLVITKPPAESPKALIITVHGKNEAKRISAGGSAHLIVDTSAESNLMDSPAPLSIYSGSSASSQNPKLIDIYERNSRWAHSKEDRLYTMAVTKKKEEMKECTFKPSRNTTLNVESVYAQKNYNNFGVVKLLNETNNSIDKRSISREKKALNSYKGIHTLKKEIVSPKRVNIESHKGNFFGGKESHKGVDLYGHYN